MANTKECAGCGKEFEEMKKCSRCKEVKYCVRECQVQAHLWKLFSLPQRKLHLELCTYLFVCLFVYLAVTPRLSKILGARCFKLSY